MNVSKVLVPITPSRREFPLSAQWPILSFEGIEVRLSGLQFPRSSFFLFIYPGGYISPFPATGMSYFSNLIDSGLAISSNSSSRIRGCISSVPERVLNFPLPHVGHRQASLLAHLKCGITASFPFLCCSLYLKNAFWLFFMALDKFSASCALVFLMPSSHAHDIPCNLPRMCSPAFTAYASLVRFSLV